MEILHFMRGRDCSDPRDVIYTALGISGQHYIVPDYSKSIREVFTAAARNIIKQTSSLEVIISLHYWPNCKQLENYDLPSWVPNFAIHRLHETLQPYLWPTKSQSQGFYYAAAAYPVQITPQIDGFSFGCKAVFAGCVSVTAYPISFENNLYTQCPPLALPWISSDQYLTGETLIDAFCRTILHDGYLWDRARSEHTPTRVSYRRSCLQQNEILAFRNALLRKCDQLGWISDSKRAKFEDGNSLPRGTTCQSTSSRKDVSSSHSVNLLEIAGKSHTFIQTTGGYIGSVYGEPKKGDLLFVIPGSDSPVVLRRAGPPVFTTSGKIQKYCFVGPAYVHGIMNGEIMHAVERGEKTMEEIVLV